MKRREKVLLTVLLGLVLGWVGYSRLESPAGGPLGKLDRQIAGLQVTRDRLKTSVARQPALLAAWDEAGRRTLADDETEASRVLDAQLKQLIRDSGLTQLNIGSASFRGKRGRVRTLTVPVTVEGTQKDLVEFLKRFYKLPFMAQLQSMTLAPSGKKNSKDLRMTAKIETIVLPETKLGGKVLPWDADAPADAAAPGLTTRLAVAEELYNKILEKNIFEPYEPPPKPPPLPQPAADDRPRPAQPPKPPPRPKDRGVITTLLAGPGRCEIRAREGRQSKVYELGDTVAGGELVFVHPYGAVIRIGGKDYLYPIGAALDQEKDRYDLGAVPVVREAMERLQAPAEPTGEPPEGAGG